MLHKKQLTRTGTHLLHIFSWPDWESRKTEQVFHQLCPLQEEQKGAIFTLYGQTKINFIGGSIILDMHLTLQDIPALRRQASLEAVSESKVLPHEFSKCFQNALLSRRRSAIYIYFCLLWYSSICATSVKSSGDSSYEAQMDEERKARLKLYKKTTGSAI